MSVAAGWLQGVTRSLASATMARNSLLGLKTGTGRAATSTGSPVRGLRAMRVLRWRILNVPNPRISMLCCSASAALTASRKESTTRAQSFFDIKGPAVRAIVAVPFSTRSALVMHPPDRPKIAHRDPSGPEDRADNIGGLAIDCQELGRTAGSAVWHHADPERPPDGTEQRKGAGLCASALLPCHH